MKTSALLLIVLIVISFTACNDSVSYVKEVENNTDHKLAVVVRQISNLDGDTIKIKPWTTEDIHIYEDEVSDIDEVGCLLRVTEIRANVLESQKKLKKDLMDENNWVSSTSSNVFGTVYTHTCTFTVNDTDLVK